MDNKNKGKILVIGATGTVGSEVLKRLVSTPSDNSIRAAVHSRNRADEISRQYTNKGIEIVDLDYMQPETITNALIDINRLFLVRKQSGFFLKIPRISDRHFWPRSYIEFPNSGNKEWRLAYRRLYAKSTHNDRQSHTGRQRWLRFDRHVRRARYLDPLRLPRRCLRCLHGQDRQGRGKHQPHSG